MFNYFVFLIKYISFSYLKYVLINLTIFLIQ